jgi:hypothetical protein
MFGMFIGLLNKLNPELVVLRTWFESFGYVLPVINPVVVFIKNTDLKLLAALVVILCQIGLFTGRLTEGFSSRTQDEKANDKKIINEGTLNFI